MRADAVLYYFVIESLRSTFDSNVRHLTLIVERGAGDGDGEKELIVDLLTLCADCAMTLESLARDAKAAVTDSDIEGMVDRFEAFAERSNKVRELLVKRAKRFGWTITG